MSTLNTIRKLLPLSAALVFALGYGVASFAQQGIRGQPDAGVAQPQLEVPMQQSEPEVRYQELVEQLTAIERDTILNRPDLQSEYVELQQGAIATMEQMGHDPQGILERMNEISRELEAAAPDTPEQEALLLDFETQRLQLAMAEQDALQDEELRSAHSAFQENLLQAQRERHPEIDALLLELLTLQQQIEGGSSEALKAPQ